MGVTPRASATAITSRAKVSKAAKRSASAKLALIESGVKAVANSIAP